MTIGGTRINAWSNPDLVLFHGTDQDGAESIRRLGISLDFSRIRTDFGLGFYTTTNRYEAESWAFVRSQKTGQAAELAVITIPRMTLGVLESLWFVRGDRDAKDYWSFVDHCRQGREGHGKERVYDIVIGPVSNYPNREVFPFYDQISFHSGPAVDCLNKADKVFERMSAR